jgi:hypothetical protein
VKKIFTFCLVFIILGCSVTPLKIIPTDYNYSPKAKIGFISLISEKPTHNHIGMTIFGNFTKDLDASWDLNDYIFSEFAAQFKNTKGYELVNLSKNEATHYLFDNENLLKTDKSGYTDVNTTELNRFKELTGITDLDAIIVISSRKLFYNKDYDRITESLGKQGDHGFKSRAGEGMFYYAGIGSQMYSFSPKAHYLGWQFLGLVNEKVIPEPQSYEQLTKEELVAYEKYFKKNISIKIGELISKSP